MGDNDASAEGLLLPCCCREHGIRRGQAAASPTLLQGSMRRPEYQSDEAVRRITMQAAASQWLSGRLWGVDEL